MAEAIFSSLLNKQRNKQTKARRKWRRITVQVKDVDPGTFYEALCSARQETDPEALSKAVTVRSGGQSQAVCGWKKKHREA